MKTKDPIDPEIVFFGLIFVNFGPLKILPKHNHLYQMQHNRITKLIR